MPADFSGMSGGSARQAATQNSDVRDLSQALSRLFEEHNRALHSFLVMRLGSDSEAKEVAQEAYVRVLRLDQVGAISFLRAYLFRTAANIAVDRIRQRTARTRLDKAAFAAEDAVDCLSPDRQVMASEQLSILERALSELPPHYRRAFILHRFDERSTEHIARDLGVRQRMVRNYISRTTIYCKLRLNGLTPSEAKAQVKP